MAGFIFYLLYHYTHQVSVNHTDSLFAKSVSVKNGKYLIIGLIYCPPDAYLNIFKTKLDKTILC